MASVKLLDPNDPKHKLDRYELIGEIATGGMAVVYLARIAGLGGFQRFVAIKRLHTHLAGEQEFVEMFLDEARLAAGIHNPHVVPILEVGGADSGYYLVMEYIEGDTLARVASRAAGRQTGLHPAATGNIGASGRASAPYAPGPGGSRSRPTGPDAVVTGSRMRAAPGSMPTAGPAIPRPVVVRILLDSLAGLHAAHELTDPHGRALSIVHRDISPQNILVGVDGSTRITDFGVARAAARLSTTRSDTVKGKLAYLSPEQARGEQCDRRTDLFAMGIILWELLTGRRLFRGETDHETLARVLGGNIPPPSSLVPGMHPAFDAVSLRALARDVSQRFGSCAEMADALERAAAEAASAGAEGGVAAARDVAAFMNQVLGQEVAAQRESVRVWLSQRNDPSLASSRPAPMTRNILATGQQAIVAPLPAPPLLAGMSASSSSVPPPDLRAAGPPPAGTRDPEDGDPTTMRHVSSLTNAAIAVRSKGASEPPFARRSRTARVAAIVGAAALLAIGVVVLLKSGDSPPRAASSGAPAETGSPAAQGAALPAPSAAPSTAAAEAAPGPSTSPRASQATTADPAGEAPTFEPVAAADGPGRPAKWHPPTAKATAATPSATAPAATTPAATAPPVKPPKGDDDLSNPYK